MLICKAWLDIVRLDADYGVLKELLRDSICMPRRMLAVIPKPSGAIVILASHALF